MRHLILRIVVMMIAFGAGLGIDRLISKPNVVPTPQVQNCEPVALQPVAETVAPPPPTPVAVETPNAVFDFNPDKFLPDGAYTMIEPAPKEFKQFSAFLLEWTATTEGRSGYIWTTTTSNDSYDCQLAVFGLVTTKRVFWVSTQMFDGEFEYRFDGEFLRTDFETVANTNKPVVRGTLTKTKNGRKVAESVVSFSLEYDRC
jgi:hypothetical protein